MSIIHISACIYSGLGKYQYFEFGWENSWVITEQLYSLPWWEQYIQTAFNTSSLMMGEGVYVLPNTVLEYVYYIMAMISTCIITAYIINEMGTIMNNLKKEKQDHINDMTILNQFMQKKQISLELQLRTRNYFEYLYELKHEMTDENELNVIQKLSKNLQEELIQYSQTKYINQIPILKCFSQKFQNECSYILEEHMYSNNEDIFSLEKLSYNDNLSLYYIHRGEVQLCKNDQLICQLQKSQILGTENLITGQISQYSAKSKGFSILYKLNISLFLQLLDQFPIDKEKFVHMRESYLSSSFSQFQQYIPPCYICNKSSHFIGNCDFLIVNKNKCEIFLDQLKNKGSSIQERKRYFRPKTKKMNAYENIMGLDKLKELQFINLDEKLDIYFYYNKRNIQEISSEKTNSQISQSSISQSNISSPQKRKQTFINQSILNQKRKKSSFQFLNYANQNQQKNNNFNSLYQEDIQFLKKYDNFQNQYGNQDIDDFKNQVQQQDQRYESQNLQNTLNENQQQKLDYLNQANPSIDSFDQLNYSTFQDIQQSTLNNNNKQEDQQSKHESLKKAIIEFNKKSEKLQKNCRKNFQRSQTYNINSNKQQFQQIKRKQQLSKSKIITIDKSLSQSQQFQGMGNSSIFCKQVLKRGANKSLTNNFDKINKKTSKSSQIIFDGILSSQKLSKSIITQTNVSNPSQQSMENTSKNAEEQQSTMTQEPEQKSKEICINQFVKIEFFETHYLYQIFKPHNNYDVILKDINFKANLRVKKMAIKKKEKLKKQLQLKAKIEKEQQIEQSMILLKDKMLNSVDIQVRSNSRSIYVNSLYNRSQTPSSQLYKQQYQNSQNNSQQSQILSNFSQKIEPNEEDSTSNRNPTTSILSVRGITMQQPRSKNQSQFNQQNTLKKLNTIQN